MLETPRTIAMGSINRWDVHGQVSSEASEPTLDEVAVWQVSFDRRRRFDALAGVLDAAASLDPLSAIQEITMVALALLGGSGAAVVITTGGRAEAIAIAGQGAASFTNAGRVTATAPPDLTNPSSPVEVVGVDAAGRGTVLARIPAETSSLGSASLIVQGVDTRHLTSTDLDWTVGVATVIALHLRGAAELTSSEATTSLASRPFLIDRLRRCGARIQRTGEHVGVYAVVITELARYRAALGERGARAIVEELGRRMANELTADALVGHVHGETIVVVSPGLPDAAAIGAVAHRLGDAATEPIVVGGETISLRTTVGVSSLGPDRSPIDREELIENALRAAADATAASPVAYFDTHTGAAALRHLRDEQSVRERLERAEVVAHLQPIADLRSGEVLGAEVLLRWSRPGGAAKEPAPLLPLALRLGFGGRIAELMLRELTFVMGEIPIERARFLSVNVAATDLADRDSVLTLVRLVDELEIDPTRLVFELTEESVVDPNVVRGLGILRSTGARLAIDDFGAGYSALGILQEVAVDALKLDISLVRQAAALGNSTVLRAAARLGSELGLLVVAEGIETDAELAAAIDAGCTAAQGHLIGRPMPLSTFRSWQLPGVVGSIGRHGPG